MKLTQSQFLNKWLPIQLANCPTRILNRLGKPEVERRLSLSILKNWENYSDPSKSQGAYNYCKVKGATLDDYANRMLKTPFGELLTSIRFVGGDLTKPAVFILYKDFELKSITAVNQLGALLKEEYQLFKPKRIRWYTCQENSAFKEYKEIIAGDLGYYSGFIDELQANPKPIHFDKVNLVLAKTLDWYEQYTTSFEEIYQQNPSFIEMASIESKEVLQEMMEAGHLYEIIIDEQFAGIIGTCIEDHEIFSGHVIYEEFLLGRFRGRWFASAVQRHLIDKLPSGVNSMLYGTIHHQNIASIKTAKRNGREWIGEYLFAKI